jgi:hypothetical protein
VADFKNVEVRYRASLRQLIEAGLIPVGRTGALATFKPIGVPPKDSNGLGRLRIASDPEVRPIDGHADLYALTLLTPAMLTDPRSDKPIEQQYVDHIEGHTGGKLLRSFTSRRLAGGHIAKRRRPYGPGTFYPFVLTEPGSVFLVKGRDHGKLAEIARFGLPPVALTGVDPLTWKNCPYLRENGYGEVAFSLINHSALFESAKSKAVPAYV